MHIRFQENCSLAIQWVDILEKNRLDKIVIKEQVYLKTNKHHLIKYVQEFRFIKPKLLLI
jgi:hypothetical protein